MFLKRPENSRIYFSLLDQEINLRIYFISKMVRSFHIGTNLRPLFSGFALIKDETLFRMNIQQNKFNVLVCLFFLLLQILNSMSDL